jgi:hypothetical protein
MFLHAGEISLPFDKGVATHNATCFTLGSRFDAGILPSRTHNLGDRESEDYSTYEYQYKDQIHDVPFEMSLGLWRW